MAEILKPIERPKWADTTSDVVTPSNSKQDSGWTGPPEKPPYQFFNWIQKWTYRWLIWAESKIDASLGGSATQTYVILSGVVTPAVAQIKVDTEGLLAVDDLTNLLTSNLDDGRILILSCLNAARVVTIKNNFGGAGQISTAFADDIILDSVSKFVVLQRSGSNWIEISRTVSPFQNVVNVGLTATTPKVSGYDLGSATFRFDGFLSTLNASSLVANLPPSTDNALSLGSSSFAYANFFASNLDTGSANTTLAIGSANATIINIGRTGAIVNILGAVNTITTTNTEVTDALVTFNKNGLAASGSNSGFEIEEGGAIAGYAKTSTGGASLPVSRETFLVKSPARAGIRSLRAPSVGVAAIEGSYHQAQLFGSFTIDAVDVLVSHNATLAASSIVTVLGMFISSRLVSTGATLVSTGGTVVTQF